MTQHYWILQGQRSISGSLYLELICHFFWLTVFSPCTTTHPPSLLQLIALRREKKSSHKTKIWNMSTCDFFYFSGKLSSWTRKRTKVYHVLYFLFLSNLIDIFSLLLFFSTADFSLKYLSYTIKFSGEMLSHKVISAVGWRDQIAAESKLIENTNVFSVYKPTLKRPGREVSLAMIITCRTRGVVSSFSCNVKCVF